MLEMFPFSDCIFSLLILLTGYDAILTNVSVLWLFNPGGLVLLIIFHRFDRTLCQGYQFLITILLGLTLGISTIRLRKLLWNLLLRCLSWLDMINSAHVYTRQCDRFLRFLNLVSIHNHDNALLFQKMFPFSDCICGSLILLSGYYAILIDVSVLWLFNPGGFVLLPRLYIMFHRFNRILCYGYQFVNYNSGRFDSQNFNDALPIVLIPLLLSVLLN